MTNEFNIDQLSREQVIALKVGIFAVKSKPVNNGKHFTIK